ncbi:MAG: CHAD domain-containing protein [Xanthobacteraceae bacterium]
MSVPRETELKLDLPPDGMAMLTRSAVFKDAPRTAPRPKKIVSVYFDTGNFKLRNSGLTLRVRREGRRRVQTVKQEGERAPLLARNEWERPIRGRRPDFAAARDTALEPLLSKKLERQLKPVFETSVRRTVYPLRNGDTEIELTVDEGTVEAGGKSSPLYEVELELKRGAPADLFRLAQALAEDVPVQISVRTKAERGYALVGREKPAPVKALLVALKPDFTAQAAFQTVARACLHQLIANRPFVRIGQPEGLHQMRVGLRRLRAAISLFSGMLSDTQTQEMKAQLRWLNGELRAARELDVFMSRVVKPPVDAKRDKPGLAALIKDLRKRRAEAYARVRSAIDSYRFRRLVLDAAAWIEVGDWTRNSDDLACALRERPISSVAADELQRRRKKILKRGAHLKTLEPHRRHTLRIQAKKVRYASEFFANVFPGKKSARRREAFIAALEKLQDALGELNDIAVHEELSAVLAQEQNGDGTPRKVHAKEAFAAGRLSGYEEARMASALQDAERAYRLASRAKPFWR